MGKITIKFDTDSAAFFDNNPYVELHEVLKRIGVTISAAETNASYPIRDSNGNTIGSIALDS